MRIKNSEFVKSYVSVADMTDLEPLPEICVAGRSNVGKSSFLNLIMERKIAKTSSTPGLTRMINVFKVRYCTDDNIDKFFYFVDLPGYGYAAASGDQIRKFSALTDSYFHSDRKITQTILLVDCRRATDDDLLMIDYLYKQNRPFFIVATKTDKFSRAQTFRAIDEIAVKLKTARGNIIGVSALKKQGADAVKAKLQLVIENAE